MTLADGASLALAFGLWLYLECLSLGPAKDGWSNIKVALDITSKTSNFMREKKNCLLFTSFPWGLTIPDYICLRTECLTAERNVKQ